MYFKSGIRITSTLLAGSIGGSILFFTGLPAAFLTGAMVTVGALAIYGVPVLIGEPLRNLAFFVIAVVLGSTVTEETIAALPAWPISLSVQMIGVLVLLALAPRYLSHRFKYDRTTATLASVPGALTFTILLAQKLGADDRRVAAIQSGRLAIILIIVPFLFTLFVEAKPLPQQPVFEISVLEIVSLAFACACAGLLARLVKLPAPLFAGPMLCSATIFGSGLITGTLPVAIMWPALVVAGSAIGVRFLGTGLAFLRESLLAGLAVTGIGLLLSAAIALPVALFLALPFTQIWLAFMPGGLEAMTVLAYSLGEDSAFVGGHQLARFMLISLSLPFLARRLL